MLTAPGNSPDRNSIGSLSPGGTGSHKRLRGMSEMLQPGFGNGNGSEDGDNRTRNAKAQRRHREKRKAHLKALEDSVSVLTAQLEDARRQLGQAAYRGLPISPQSKDLAQLAAENAYLRDENADLRRQLYSHRVNYGGGHPIPPPPPPNLGDEGKDGWIGEVKSEPGGGAGAFGVTYGQSSMSSPSTGHGRGGSAHERMRPSGEFVGYHAVNSTAEASSAPSTASSYPVQGDYRNRSRMASSSSAPAASPYLPSPSSFPTDPRSHSLSSAGPGTNAQHSTQNHTHTHTPIMENRYPPIRYDSHMYPPPPHTIPRAGGTGGVGMYGDIQAGYGGGREGGGGDGIWGGGNDSGPPPLSGQGGYGIGFDHQGGEDWRG